MSQHQLDVLAVGDVVTDDFIKLLDSEERIEKRPDGNWLAIPFATKVPFDHSEVIPGVGNAANAAVAFAKMGFHSGLVSNVGDDTHGREIIKALQHKDVDVRFVHINNGKNSNYHYVLWYKDERSILIKHEDYSYHWPRFRVIDIPKWIYFSSVSEHAEDYHHQIVDWLDSHPPVKLAFQPGTFQMKMGADKLKRLYKRTEVLIVNREEAVLVGGGKKEDINDLFDKLHGLGPKIVVITDGPKGAYASDGINRYKMPNYPDPKPPFERTGAGDAFAATFVGALMKGASVEGALLWAPINSMSVVQKVGAQAGLLEVREIDKLLRSAPNWYHPEKI